MTDLKNLKIESSKPIPIPSDIKKSDSHGDKLNFLYNSEELYYSSDLVFPPNNNPPDNNNNNKNNYVQILDSKSKISPGSYERFSINKYFSQ